MDPIIRIPATSAVRRRIGRSNDLGNSSAQTVANDESVNASGKASVTPALPKEPVAATAEFDLKVKMQIEQEVAAVRAETERRGFIAGLERGEDLAKREATGQLERLLAIAASLTTIRDDAVNNAEAALVEIVYAAVCRIVGDVAVTREGVVGVINETLRSSQQNGELIVNLHPQDIELIQSVNDARMALDALPYKLRADASVQIGGCTVEGPSGTLDARLDVQLSNLREAILTVRRNRANSPEVI